MDKLICAASDTLVRATDQGTHASRDIAMVFRNYALYRHKRGVRLAARLHAASAQTHDGALPLRFDAQHMHLLCPATSERIEL